MSTMASNKKRKRSEVEWEDAGNGSENGSKKQKLDMAPKAHHLFLSVTSFDGKRVYITPSAITTTVQQTRTTDLLSLPFDQLQAWVDRARLSEEIAKRTPLEEIVKGTAELKPEHAEQKLWVDKYAPQRFVDLLGEDRVNRQVLSWLHEWSECVFGFKAGTQPAGTVKHARTATRLRELDTRPKHKVLLLWGPPGAGKTTLAHVAARHAGYHPVEINASDDRSVETFTEKVVQATTMQSVLSDTRPNCLIIDEIDGVLMAKEDRGVIDALLRVVKAGESARGSENATGPRSQLRPLSRPIICICNDVWTTALRRLRDEALVVRYRPADTPRIVKRLKEIAASEGLSVDTRTLVALAEQAQGDIRSALHSLQFLAAHRGPAAASLAVVGVKDTTHSLFDLWRAVFQRRPPSAANVSSTLATLWADRLADDPELARVLGTGGERATAVASRGSVADVWDLVSQHGGEWDKLMAGCFENYVRQPYIDGRLTRTSAAVDWLVWWDAVATDQPAMAHLYAPPVAAAVHHTCAVETHHHPPDLKYPSHDWQVKTRQTELLSMARHVAMSRAASTRAGLMPQTTAAVELLPAMLPCIAPALRPVSSLHMLSPRERDDVARTVAAMMAYNVDYKETTQLAGVALRGYKLDPPLHELALFESALPPPASWYARFTALTDLHKEMLHTEIQLLRTAAKRPPSAQQTPTDQALVPRKAASKTPDHKPGVEAQQLLANTQQLIPVRAAVCLPSAATVTQHFSPPRVTAPSSKPIRVQFQFREGHTNAVRRKVLVRDWL